MVTKDDLCDWVVEALEAHGGSARIVPICKYIWDHYENELKGSGDLLYKWQYEVRWAGQTLRDNGTLVRVDGKKNKPWELQKRR